MACTSPGGRLRASTALFLLALVPQTLAQSGLLDQGSGKQSKPDAVPNESSHMDLYSLYALRHLLAYPGAYPGTYPAAPPIEPPPMEPPTNPPPYPVESPPPEPMSPPPYPYGPMAPPDIPASPPSPISPPTSPSPPPSPIPPPMSPAYPPPPISPPSSPSPPPQPISPPDSPPPPESPISPPSTPMPPSPPISPPMPPPLPVDEVDCDTPNVIDLPGTAAGNNITVESIDTCNASNTHDGNDWSLSGSDYTFFLKPADGVRLMTVETKAASGNKSFDTVLYAFEVCDEFHTWDSWRTRNDAKEDGDDRLSKLEWTMEPNQGMYVVLTGFGSECGVIDIVFTAETPPPPSPPMPPLPQPPPPLPPVCFADRLKSPTGGFLDWCAVHNDPHIRTFNISGQNRLTCDIQGQFTILENEFIIINGTGVTDLFPDWRGASLVESVEISYKDPACGGKTVLGVGPQRIEVWHNPLLNTKVMTARYEMFKDQQSYLSVFIVTPWTGDNGICVANQCPSGTEVDLFRRKRALQQPGTNVTEDEAERLCSEQGMDGFFLETCKFDSVGTQDPKAFLASNKDSEEEAEVVEEEVEDDNKALAQSLRPPPPPPLFGPTPTPSPSPSPSPSPTPSPQPAPADGVCSTSNETAAVFLLEVDMDFTDVNGTNFKDNLVDALRTNIPLEFPDFFGNFSSAVTNCSNFVEVELSPGSVIATVFVNLGANAGDADISTFEEEVNSLSADQAQRRLLDGMAEVIAIGLTEDDLAGQETEGGAVTAIGLLTSFMAPLAALVAHYLGGAQLQL